MVVNPDDSWYQLTKSSQTSAHQMQNSQPSARRLNSFKEGTLTSSLMDHTLRGEQEVVADARTICIGAPKSAACRIATAVVVQAKSISFVAGLPPNNYQPTLTLT